MARKLDPKIGDVLRAHGFGADAIWDCHGTWVVYHHVLEQIAAKAGITYEAPSVLVAEKESAAILVTGTFDGKREWSIGEASIGLNYKVSGKQAAYPFAMAEKRAKDRVILKLIGLHGLAYSEEEADEFKGRQPVADDGEAVSRGTKDAFLRTAEVMIDGFTTVASMTAWWNSDDQKKQRRDFDLSAAEVDGLKARLITQKDHIEEKEAA